MDDKNIHAGHRERMYQKVFSNPDALAEHELLEILLFSVLPRVNTNPLAHKLLQVFGSLEGVFNAKPEFLASVDGVGERTASYLATIGKVYNQVQAKKKKEEISWTSLDKIEQNVKDYFSGLTDEYLVVVLLNEKKHKIADLRFTNKSEDSINVAIIDIAHAISIHKPDSIIIAHNHPHTTCSPSTTDDMATQKVIFLCDVHGVRFLDHIIVGKDGIYSYWQNGLIDKIRKQ